MTIHRIYKIRSVPNPKPGPELRELDDTFTFSDNLVRVQIAVRELTDSFTFTDDTDYIVTVAGAPGAPAAPTALTGVIRDIAC